MMTLALVRPLLDAMSEAACVVCETGALVYQNPSMRALVGALDAAAPTGTLLDLFDRDAQGPILAMIASARRGEPAAALDANPSKGEGVFSLAPSAAFPNEPYVLVFVRDVTIERALETELRSTTEFLERLIDSTVDAIVAADMSGRIILFNRGAERLFGYAAGDAIGRNVEGMYEAGVAKQVMRMLRSTSYGGVGRLEKMRREVRATTGELVPVSLTASIVYEGANEVATVGIMTDLRDRIHMEQRLIVAQHKLQASEKQALVAEIAAATAHELNQPLTSIMAYAELLLRQSASDARATRAARTILSESERMAAIVKKIGRITRYETVDYVGNTRMLDLARAAEEEGGAVTAAIDDDAPTSATMATESAGERNE